MFVLKVVSCLLGGVVVVQGWSSGFNPTNFFRAIRSLHDSNTKQAFSLIRKLATASILAVSCSTCLPSASIAAERSSLIAQQLQEIRDTVSEGSTLQSQIQMLRLQEQDQQKDKLKLAEQEMVTKELKYPDGFLISRGSVILDSPGSQSLYPLGLSKASDLDPVYSSDTASLFVLAVGREGPPMAAKRYFLKDVTFPLVLELTTDDLLFPYTPEAWTKNANSKDSIAMTAIITASPTLSTSTGTERYGFAISDPIVFAGKPSRTSATMRVAGKIDKALYSDAERALLDSIDQEILRHESKDSQASSSKISTTVSGSRK